MKDKKSGWILALICICIFALVQQGTVSAAISGSFYAQDYVLAQGEEISSRDIYVVAFNKGDTCVCIDMEYEVQMAGEASDSIVVNLTPGRFLLDPDDYKRVYISLKAKADAIPSDNYTVKVIVPLRKLHFCWHKVPGVDNERLLKLLVVEFELDWAKNATINKSADNMTIKISTAEDAAEITLDDARKSATLNISDGRTYELVAKSEDGELCIYNKVPGEQSIKVLTSAAQEATVTVTGEYADVDVVAIDPAGNVASTACVRLFRSGYAIASAEGELKKRVIPGNYTAKAYLLDKEEASADFVVATYEYKRVELPITGVYFEHFSVEPMKSGSGAIIYVPVAAVVSNSYKELPNASIILDVYTGVSSENYTLYSSVSLPMDRTETQFNYIPLMGWQSGKYEFTAKVVSDGIVYAVSQVITVEDLTFGADYKRAQTFVFTGNDTTVTNVRVYLKRTGVSVTGDIIVKIHEDGGTEPGTELAGCTIANSSVNTSYSWVNGSCNCALANGTTYWLVLASPDASDGYDYYWGADYNKSDGGEAWYYDAKSWTTANLECVTMTFELFV